MAEAKLWSLGQSVLEISMPLVIYHPFTPWSTDMESPDLQISCRPAKSDKPVSVMLILSAVRLSLPELDVASRLQSCMSRMRT